MASFGVVHKVIGEDNLVDNALRNGMPMTKADLMRMAKHLGLRMCRPRWLGRDR